MVFVITVLLREGSFGSNFRGSLSCDSGKSASNQGVHLCFFGEIAKMLSATLSCCEVDRFLRPYTFCSNRFCKSTFGLSFVNVRSPEQSSVRVLPKFCTRSTRQTLLPKGKCGSPSAMADFENSPQTPQKLAPQQPHWYYVNKKGEQVRREKSSFGTSSFF